MTASWRAVSCIYLQCTRLHLILRITPLSSVPSLGDPRLIAVSGSESLSFNSTVLRKRARSISPRMMFDPGGPIEQWLGDDAILKFDASVALSPRVSRRTNHNSRYRHDKSPLTRRIQLYLKVIRDRKEILRDALVPAKKLWSTWTAEAGFTALFVAYPVLECMATYLHQSDFKSLSYSSKTMYSVIQQTCGKNSWKIVNRLTCTGFHKARCHFSKCRIPVCTVSPYPDPHQVLGLKP